MEVFQKRMVMFFREFCDGNWSVVLLMLMERNLQPSIKVYSYSKEREREITTRQISTSFQVYLYLAQDSWYSFSIRYEFTQVIIIQITFLSLVYKYVKYTLSNTVLKASPWWKGITSIKMSLECLVFIASTWLSFLVINDNKTIGVIILPSTSSVTDIMFTSLLFLNPFFQNF